MLKKLMFGLILTQMACGSEEKVRVTRNIHNLSFDEYLSTNVDGPIRPHFAEFIEFCKLSSPEDSSLCLSNLSSLNSVRLKRGPVDDANPLVIGVCEISLDRSITIRSDIFDQKSIAFKALVWHELGHCLLDLDHIEGINTHIMNATLPSARVLQLSWHTFVKDFFLSRVKLSLTGPSVSDFSGDYRE